MTEAQRTRRASHPARWIAGGLLAALVVLAIVAATRPSQQATAVDGPLVGKSAPRFSGQGLGGQHVTLSQFRGRYVYVNFFASWCQPCQTEEPNLVQFAYEQAHRTGGAAVLSVVFQDNDARALAFLKSQGATFWSTLTDPGGVIANDYGVGAPPTTFLISPRGTVVGEYVAPVTVSQLDSMLASARVHHGNSPSGA